MKFEAGVDVADFKTAIGLLSLQGQRLGAKLRYKNASDAALEVGLSSGTTLICNMKGDFSLTRKRATRLGTLQIKQYVPRGQLFLVPSPEIKLSLKPLRLPATLCAETTLLWDFQNARGSVQQDLTARNRYKASATMHSVLGLTQVGLTAKTGFSSGLSSLGLTLSRASGPWIKAEGAVTAGGRGAVRGKVDVQLQGKETQVELSVPAVENKVRVVLNGAVRSVKTNKRSVLLGAKLELQR